MTYTFRSRGVCSQEMRWRWMTPASSRRWRSWAAAAATSRDFRPGGGDACPGGDPPFEGHPLRCQEHLLPRSVRLRAGVRPGQTEISLRQALRHLPQGLLFRVRSEIPQATKFLDKR